MNDDDEAKDTKKVWAKREKLMSQSILPHLSNMMEPVLWPVEPVNNCLLMTS